MQANTVSNTNTIRKRTQRTFALENDIVSDISQGMNRHDRRANLAIAKLRFARLGSLSDLVDGAHTPVERMIFKSIKRQYNTLPKEKRTLQANYTEYQDRN